MIATRKSSFLPTRKGGVGEEEREHKRTFLRTFAEGRRTAAGSVCTPLFLPLSLAPSHLSGIRTLFAPFFFSLLLFSFSRLKLVFNLKEGSIASSVTCCA